MMGKVLLLGAALLTSSPHETEQRSAPPAEVQKKGPSSPVEKVTCEEKPVVTHHAVTVDGKPLPYTVTTGMMPVASGTGETDANLFFIAYTADNSVSKRDRPLLFIFNGGPGSSSVWLHLGTIGPKRVELLADGRMPPPPYRLTDNGDTWLTEADLVFIDPVGTGYSRAVNPEVGKKFFSLKGDLDSVGEFIRLYLTRYERWSSPIFLVGESYGSTRAAGLAGELFERGIAFNGVMLVSSILNFSTIGFSPGNDLPYALYLPTYAATARFHGKGPGSEGVELAATVAEVEKWALGDYLVALGRGNTLPPQERQAVVKKLSRYTGLDERYIDNCNLRVEAQRFTKELLRERKMMTGRFDARILGIPLSAAGEDPEYDVSLTEIRPPFTAALNDYIRVDLGYRSDREYYILGGGIGRWDWGATNSYLDMSEQLRTAMAKNRYMKVFVASGYYDLATPYLGAEYTLNHLELDPELRRNVTVRHYEAGHMMYTDTRSRLALKKDVTAFIRDAAGRR